MAIQRSLVDAVEVTDSQIHIIRLKGIFDASTVSEFEKVVSYLLAKSFFKMVVDLGQVEFISSAGWGAFTAELRRVRESDGDIKLCGMSTELFDVFLLLELDSFIRAYDTDEEAMTAFLPAAPAPQPAPVVEATAEIAAPASAETYMMPVVAETQFAPAEEKQLPVIFSGLIAPRREFEVEHRRPGVGPMQEKLAFENKAFELEAEAPALTHDGDNDFSYPQNFVNNDDTIEIDADSPIAAHGPEMYELFLTSGQPALDSAIGRRALPSTRALGPPSRQVLPNSLYERGVSEPALEQEKYGDFGDDIREHEASDSIVERYNHVDFGDNDNHEASESIVERYNHVNLGDDRDEHEADEPFAQQEAHDLGTAPEPGFYEHEPIADDTQYLETQEFADLISNEALHFSGHEPIVEETVHENTERNGAATQENETDISHSTAEPEAVLPGPKSFVWEDTEALSELSLDLESHLQEHQRVVETRNGSAELYNRSATRENEPSPTPSGNATEEFEPPIFSSGSEVGEYADADDGENYAQEFSEPELETTPDFPAPAYDNSGSHDKLSAPLFSIDFANVSPNAFASANNSAPEQDDEFETQDIRDPWILEEIDTLPEEYEMDEVTAEDDTPIAVSEFISGDFEVELEPLTLAPVNENAPSALWPETESVDTHVTPNLPTVGDETPAEPMPSEASTDEAYEEMAASPGLQAMNGDNEAYPAPTLTATRSTNGKKKSSFDPFSLEGLPKIPMSNNIAEMVCGIIAAYPDFGPNMICKFLEERVEPPVYLSRSTVYRYLCEVGLNTREKRYEYAGQEINFTDAGAMDVAQEA